MTRNDRPILFSAPMVRAILDDKKTQTRRVAKLVQELSAKHERVRVRKHPPREVWGVGRDAMHTPMLRENFEVECPYGVPGDRLWVKEGWKTGKTLDLFNATEIAKQCMSAGYRTPGADVWYSADNFHRRFEDRAVPFGGPGRTRSSRFMPRWASRITLEITEVRVERVQEISEEDALAEGVELMAHCCVCHQDFPDSLVTFTIDKADICPKCKSENFTVVLDGHVECCDSMPHPREQFSNLWDSINAKRGFGWDVNPWVWAITFRRVESK